MTSAKNDYITFFKTIGKSKRLLRSGWIEHKIKDPESVAEHSFRVAMMAMVLSNKLGYNLDAAKMVKMALLHDTGEVITGDVIVSRGSIIDIEARDTKEIEEREGIRNIFDLIGDAEEYTAIFQEMMDRTTVEAKVFWQLDKLEMAIQASEYEEEQKKDLEEFLINADLNMKEPLLREIFEGLLKKGKRKK